MTQTQTNAVFWGTSKQATIDNRINIHPNAPFYLMHHPLGWEFTHGEWSPTFSELREESGINGVQQTPNGPDSTIARVHYLDQGYIVLDYKSLGYLTRQPTKYGGHFYSLIYATCKQLAGNVFWQLDHDAYNEFRRSLVIDGHIDPPDPDVLNMLIDRYKRRLERLYRNQHIPEIKIKLERADQHMKDMIEAAQALFAPPKRSKKNGK